jgi:hypothetical protein
MKVIVLKDHKLELVIVSEKNDAFEPIISNTSCYKFSFKIEMSLF